MKQTNGVNYLFDVLFHEVMEGHPASRERLNDRLASLYQHFTLSQREAVNQVFSELCHQSFSACFNMTTHEVMLTT